jgi:glycosyltransferase involved in cell wall biosynthesis
LRRLTGGKPSSGCPYPGKTAESQLKASIVIPAHNEEAYIESALKMALEQDYAGHYEVIVVDNASTDMTSVVARDFGVKVVQENKKGVQHARERGRLEAKGGILAYLDADCIPPRDWLRRGVGHFSDLEVVGVSGPYDYFDARPLLSCSTYLLQITFFPLAHFLTHNIFRRAGVMIGGNAFIRSSALAKIEGFDTSIDFFGDDTDTARRLRGIGKLLFRKDLTVRSSSRRFDRTNPFYLSFVYITNYIWVVLFKHPFSR